MKNPSRRAALLSGGLAAAAVLCFALLGGCSHGLKRYDSIRFPGPLDTAVAAPSGVRVTFLGVSTLLIRDSATAFMTDAFFSRPQLPSLLFPLRPNQGRIDYVFARLKAGGQGVDRLEAVIPFHAHYDHAMDAPIVADSLRARLIGSASVAAVARSEKGGDTIETVRAGDRARVGRFEVTFIECIHGPPDRWPGVVGAPFRTPAKVGRYRTGNCFTLLVRHQARCLLVTGTAGFVPGAMRDARAEVVYLSIGGLGKQDALYRASYWDEVVRDMGARRVVLIHWDDFFRPLSRPLIPAPRLGDDLGETIEHYRVLAERDRVDLRVAREWTAADPFAGLPPDTTRVSANCAAPAPVPAG
jgi:L-ascorbate metabolism protein UlaG (beta-lactamase superfamily)